MASDVIKDLEGGEWYLLVNRIEKGIESLSHNCHWSHSEINYKPASVTSFLWIICIVYRVYLPPVQNILEYYTWIPECDRVYSSHRLTRCGFWMSCRLNWDRLKIPYENPGNNPRARFSKVPKRPANPFLIICKNEPLGSYDFVKVF